MINKNFKRKKIMKKFLMMFALVMGFAVSTFAQTALVDNGTVKDNWYVGGGIGTNVWNSVDSWKAFNSKVNGVNHSWWRSQPLQANVTIGKMVTPYVGAEVDYTGVFNLYGSHTFIDAHNLTGNVVVNLTNVIGGYKGHRRGFELELLGGAGWVHDFDSDYAKGTTGGNAMSVRGALRGNFNLGEQWAITVTPEYLWLPNHFVKMDAYQGVNLSVGVKYRFKTKRGGFDVKALRDQAEIDGLNSTISRLQSANDDLAKANAALTDALNKALANGDKVVVKTQSVGTFFFDKGKANVNANDVAKIVEALKATDGSIVLTGNTSPEGSESVNKKLAVERAKSVKDALVANGVDASRITINNDYTNKRSVVVTVQ